MGNMELKKEYEPFIKDIVRSLPAMLFFKDTEGKYVFTTKVCDLIQAGPEGTIIGKWDTDIQYDKALGRRYYEEDQEILKTGISTHTIDRIATPDGGEVYIEVLKEAIRNDEGEIIGICGICNDVTELETMRQQYEKLSLFDPLTGLYNRNYAFAHIFDEEQCLPCSYIFCDCNNLKKVNDRMGHEAGDQYIRRVSELLKSSAPEQSVIIRWGGDEFLMITPNCSGTLHETLMGRIRDAQKILSGISPEMGLSVGGMLREDKEIPEPEVMKLADERMYADKAANKK